MGWEEIQTYIKMGAMSNNGIAFLKKTFNKTPMRNGPKNCILKLLIRNKIET
jgi:hypothetical protein